MEELLTYLKYQNIIDARRITIRRNGQVRSMKHIILNFNSSTLSTRIKPAYLSCPVRIYKTNSVILSISYMAIILLPVVDQLPTHVVENPAMTVNFATELNAATNVKMPCSILSLLSKLYP